MKKIKKNKEIFKKEDRIRKIEKEIDKLQKEQDESYKLLQEKVTPELYHEILQLIGLDQALGNKIAELDELVGGED